MHVMRRIEAIKSTLDTGEEGAAEIRAAARALEESTSVGEVLAAVADPRFPGALIAAARARAAAEEKGWLTLAAAGARRARQVLAWRASQLVGAEELAALAMRRRRARKRGFEALAAAASDPGSAAAYSLLAHLRSSELRAMVRARPPLAAAHRRARAARGQLSVPALRPALG
jgi:hypothetical protein